MEYDLGVKQDYFDNMLEIIESNFTLSQQKSILIREKVIELIPAERLQVI